MNEGFPELTDSFLAGQDVFYIQFNEISFYVEDTSQEHLYFNILKRLFTDVNFEKIFPLHGKNNLKDHAKQNLGDKSKVYIADLDFEDILGIKEEIENVFYLPKYSIENILFEKNALFEIIREKNPTLKNSDIAKNFDIERLKRRCKKLLSELSIIFIIIIKYELGKEFYGLVPPRDFNLQTNPPTYKGNFINDYKNQTEISLKTKDGRFTIKSKSKSFKKYFGTIELAFTNIPGKYILNLTKYMLEKESLINNFNLDTFVYKLSKECDLDSLNPLKEDILEYVA